MLTSKAKQARALRRDRKTLAERRPAGLVVGVPRTSDGTPHK